MVYAARTKSSLSDFKPTTLTQKHVRSRNAYVFVIDFGVTVWRVIVAKHREHPGNPSARCVHPNQYHRLSFVKRRARISLAPENRDLASRVARAGAPPLSSTNDVLVTVSNDA